jgi:IclR helix-turn-helix domain
MTATGPVRTQANRQQGPGEVQVTTASRAIRRQVGPLAWAVLEELALTAQPDDRGWITPLGVRAIAAAIGVTKNTAARAVITLRSAGLVTPDRVKTTEGQSVSAYRLALPEGIDIPIQAQAVGPERGDTGSPGEDRGFQLVRQNSCRSDGQEYDGVDESSGRSRFRTALQPTLFTVESHPSESTPRAVRSRPHHGAPGARS